jgi:hypothetical protein
MSVRRMMLVIAVAALVCAGIFSGQFWCLFAILPGVGAWRGASRRPHRIWPAVEGGASWGATQGGVYAVPLLMMALMGKGEAAFFALVGLEISLILGVGAGFLIGAGFWMTRT